MKPIPAPVAARQRGFSLIDILIGLVIALVAVLVIFQVFAVSEGYKRNTTAIGEAQVNGLLSSFTMGLQLANSAAALAVAAQDLNACKDPGDADPIKNYARSWRPVPVVIFDGGADDAPDSFAVTYSTSTTIVAPALADLVPYTAGKYIVQSPTGFHPRLGGQRKDLVIAIERAPFSVTGNCYPARVDNVVDAACPGCAQLSFTGQDMGKNPYSVFNMGPSDEVQKVLYDVDAAKAVLRSTALLDDQGQPAANAPNPLASNIVNLKLQYGVDSDGDGLLDSWVSATGQWAPDQLMDPAKSPNPVAKINQIKAVRIGVIVRSEQFDKNYTQDVAWSMFDGTLNGTFAQSVSPPGNWRYRVYETVIPLRNEIWNKQL